MNRPDLNTLPDNALVRLSQVLDMIPVSKSAWYAGIKKGKYPLPVKLGDRTAAYKFSDIKALLATLTGE